MDTIKFSVVLNPRSTYMTFEEIQHTLTRLKTCNLRVKSGIWPKNQESGRRPLKKSGIREEAHKKIRNQGSGKNQESGRGVCPKKFLLGQIGGSDNSIPFYQLI